MAESWADLGVVANSTPSDGGGDDWSDLGVMAAPQARKRSNAERFGENFEDAALRNPTIAGAREAYSNPLSLLPPALQPGGLKPGRMMPDIPNLLTALPGAAGGLAIKGMIDRAMGRENAFLSAGRERERRAQYDAQSEADPFYRANGGRTGEAAAGLSTLAGQVAGAATDPQNLVGIGSTPLRRILGGVAANAAGDVETQGSDISSGVQDRYSPAQTGMAAGLGGVLAGGQEAAGPLARAAGRRIKLDAAGRKVGAIANRLDGSSHIATRDPESDWSDLGAHTDRPHADDWSDLGNARASAEQYAPAREAPASFTEADARKLLDEDIPGAKVTSGYRTPEHNAKVGGVKGSYHTLHQALDIVPPDGMTMAQLADHLRASHWATKVINEGDHVHVQWGHRAGSAAAAAPATARRPPANGFADAIEQGLPQDRPAGANEEVMAGNAEATPVTRPGDLWQLSRDELEQLHTDAGQSDREKLVRALGSEEAAKEFERLDRARNSMDPARADPAAAEFDAKYGKLTPQQERLIFGVGEIDAQAYDIKQVLDAHNDVMDGDPADWLDYMGAVSARNLSADELKRVPNGEGSPAAQAAFVRMQKVYQGLSAQGVDPNTIPRRMADALVQRAGWRPEQAAEVIGGFARDLVKGKRAPKANDWRDLGGDNPRLAALPAGNSTGLRAAPRPGAVPTGAAAKPYAGQTISQLAGKLRTALGITHRQGRVTSKGALGEYHLKTAVVRTKAVQELDVLAHEATHALEFKRGSALAAALKAHAAELEPMAYPGAAPGSLRQEGFAEFGRWYLTNPAHAQKLAPKFYAAFEKALAEDHPQAAAAMKEIQAEYQRFLASPSLKTAAASVALTGRPGPLGRVKKALQERGLWGAAQDIADDAYTAFVDDLHPVAKAVRALQDIYAANNNGQRLDLDVARNPYSLARLSREAYAAGHIDLMDGVVPYKGTDPTGPTLSGALETALGTRALGKWSKQDLREFDAYLIARRMVHEYDRYAAGELEIPPDRNSKAYHETIIHDAEAANPTWKDAADQVYGWLNNLWRKEYDAGLITQESYKNGLSKHPDYVPLMRDMSDKTATTAGRPRGAMQFSGGVDQFKGSSRDVISPLSSMMRRAYELNAIIKRNDAMKALDDLGQIAGPGSGAIVERLPLKEAEAINVDAIEALTKAAEAAGLSERDVTTLVQAADAALDGSSQATIFRQRDMSPAKGEAVVFVWREGKKTPILLPDGEFGQSMFTALTGMNRDLQNGVVDALAAGTQVLRYGVTLSPEFMSRNFVRDQLATWINTDVGFVPVYHSARGAMGEIAQTPTATRYGIAGGMRGGPNVAATRKPFPKNDLEAQAQLQHLRKKGYRTRRYASWRGLAELTDLSETSTRLGVFGAAFRQARKRGLDDYDAMLEAAFTSRDYLDFSRRGSRMLSAVRIVTFLNASLQSLDKTVRVLTAGGNLHKVLAPLGGNAPRTPAEKRALTHAYKAWAKVSALGVLGLGLRMLYADDPEYEEISDQLRATHWIAKVNGHWAFIPKPFELATLSNIFERAYEAKALKDPTAPKRLLSDFSQTIAPPHEIPAVSIPFALARNRDYQGRPIVPDNLRGTVDPEYQFNSYTSELGKRIGKALHVSPAVVDYVITGFGGSLGRYALQGGNLVDEKLTGKPAMQAGPEDYFLSRGFVKDVARGSTSQKEFWDLMAKSEGDYTKAVGTFRLLMKERDTAKATAFLNSLPSPSRAFVRAEVLGPGSLSKFHPIARAQGAIAVIGDLRRENRAGELQNLKGEPIALTPSQRREADDALAHLAMTEMRNALVETGVRGWAQKRQLPREDSLERLSAVSSELPDLLEKRMTLARVPPPGAADRYWNTLGSKLGRKAEPARTSREITAKTMKTTDRYERIQAARQARSN